MKINSWIAGVSLFLQGVVLFVFAYTGSEPMTLDFSNACGLFYALLLTSFVAFQAGREWPVNGH